MKHTDNSYLQISKQQLTDMKSLSSGAVKVYLSMLLEANGKATFTFPRSRYVDYMSSATFDRTKKELITYGFIEELEKNKELRQPNLYRLSERWKTGEALKAQKQPQNTDGYVYIMKNMGVYKIGRCNTTKERLGEYTKLPEEPEYIILTKVSDNIEAEEELQRTFHDKRMRDGKCEWFKLSDEDIEKAKEIVRQYETAK